MRGSYKKIMAKFYISDLHIGHEKIIRMDERPFSDTDQMRKAMVSNWNNAVSPDDEVYILGDFAWKNQEGLEVLRELRGRKFLVAGNHDKPTEEMTACFEWVKDHAVIKDNNTRVVLCHYPIAHWFNQFRGAVHLYGHVHNNKDYGAFKKYGEMCREMGIPFECYNVGCMLDHMGYTPRTLEEIRNAHHL